LIDPQKSRRPRLRVRGRIALSLCLIATLATFLTLVGPHYRLALDLENVSFERLERATRATATLVNRLQEQTRERHRAIAHTPEFRANLEIADVPTLDALAEMIVERENPIDTIVFTNSLGAIVSISGNRELASIFMDTEFVDPVTACEPGRTANECREIIGPADSVLSANEGRLVVGTSVPLFVRDRFVGRATFMEVQPASVLEEWSSLAGAEVSIHGKDEPRSAFDRVALTVPPFEMRVHASFAAERTALDRLRATILTSGLFALCVAFAIASPLSRSLLGPLHRIEKAAHRIRNGDRATRLRSERVDEFGDVARALDTMLDHLESTQAGLERAQSIGRLGGWSMTQGHHRMRVSRELRRILDLEEQEEEGYLDLAVMRRRIHPADLPAFDTVMKSCEDEGLPFGLDHRVVHESGRVLIVHTQAERAQNDAGQYQIEGTLQDVTERKRIEEQVAKLVYHDVLTGLGNRRLFAEELQKALSLARQNLHPLAVLFLDLDDFKTVNDTLGHSIGDQLICAVADRLSEIIVDMNQIVGEASVHRLGGDEFAIILSQLGDADGARYCAETIARRLSTSVELEGYDIRMSASVGIATWPDEGLDAATLLLGCDTAMYNAKLEGRGQYRFYKPSMREVSKRKLQLESRLRRAIEKGELSIVYQPKVDPMTSNICGFEALVRWLDRDLGQVSPGEFVAIAEETGQILALGEWVLNQVAHQAQHWVEAGLLDVSIAVNVSSYQIESDTLVDTVVGILRETGLPPCYLELEITESALLRNESHAIETLANLKDVGVKLALDDFGTGYSSLSYLRRLPIDTVKIDQSFVRDVLKDERGHDLVASIVSMAHVLGLSVVAEGVENSEERDALVDIGCELIQGYFYSAGVPADRVPEMVAEGFSGHGTTMRNSRQ